MVDKMLSNGTKNHWISKWLVKLTVIWTFYVLPWLTVGAAAALALTYLFVTLAYGAIWLILGFTLLIVSSYVLGKLVHKPELFANRPKLFRAIEIGNAFLRFIRRGLGKLHSVQIEYAKIAGKWFMALPLRTRLIAIGVTLAFVIPVSVFISIKTVETVASKWPYGRNRGDMSVEDLAKRKENRINHAMWAVWGQKDATKNAERMGQFRNLIENEANANGITPNRLEAQLFVESASSTDKVNNTSGAAGIAQIMLSVGCEEGLIADKAFCKRARAKKMKFIPKGENIDDKRLNPSAAVPVAASILGKATKYWGDENWAFVQYHMGQGFQRKLVVHYLDEVYPGWSKEFPIDRSNVPGMKNVQRFQISDPDRSIPKAIAKYGFTYDDIFFRCTPTKTPKTYSFLYRLEDSSATYVYTGLAALKGFELMRSDRTAFDKMVAEQQDPDGGLANRPMRAWYGDDEAVYNTRQDIDLAAKRGELVSVPDNAKYGFVLRTTGQNPVGECDPEHKSSYYYTRKATTGMIFFIAAKVKEQEGTDPFEVTGLIRSNWMYDVRKCLPQTQPRTHVIGSAFDIGANIKGAPMSAKTRRALIFVIRDLRADGLIDRIAEGTADHIVYNPEFQKFFEDIYDDTISQQSPLIVEP
ncbi:hypothetical protein IPM19_01340 [bacterium]|nr:MAG: hypothetical protein IPM19_01340 [bacterium]